MSKIENAMYTLATLAVLALALFGDAIIEWGDPGRIDERVEYNKSQQAHTERAVCQAFGMCVGGEK